MIQKFLKIYFLFFICMNLSIYCNKNSFSNISENNNLKFLSYSSDSLNNINFYLDNSNYNNNLVTNSFIEDEDDIENLDQPINLETGRFLPKGLFNIKGKCHYIEFPEYLLALIPSEARIIFSKLLKVIKNYKINVCYGDFQSSELLTNSSLDDTLCSTFPVLEGELSILSIKADNLTCPTKTEIKICTAFDSSYKNIFMSFNPGAISCINSLYSKLVGAINIVIKKFKTKNATEFFTLAYSKHSRLSYIVPLTIPEKDENGRYSFINIPLYVSGEFFISGGFKIPKNYIIVGNTDITSVFKIHNDYSLLFGYNSNEINEDEDPYDLIDQTVRSVQNLEDSQDLDLYASNSLRLLINITGSFELYLSNFTNNFLPDIGLTLNSNILITKGDGLDSGMYMYTQSGTSGDVVNNVNGFFEIYSPVFKFFNINVSNIIGVDFEFGMFVTKDIVGYTIKHPKLSVECFYKYELNELSCCIDKEHCFNINIYDSLKYVITTATAFFVEEGKVILTILKEEFNKKVHKINDAIKSLIGKIKDINGNIISIASEEYKKICKGNKDTYKMLKVGMLDAKTIYKYMLCSIKYMFNKEKRRQCETKINSEYYKNLVIINA